MAHDKILSLDIGGSTIKATVLNSDGELLQDYAKVKTPNRATPENVLEAIETLVEGFQNYDKISVGFPGFVKKGIVFTAPNLGTDSWKAVNLNKLIRDALQKPVRIINDADMQGLAVAKGQGLEMMKYTYDNYVGDEALEREGKEKWNRRIKKIIEILKTVFNYDHLYIGGGNASKIDFKLDENIEITTNKDGIRGGARLWELDENLFMKYHPA